MWSLSEGCRHDCLIIWERFLVFFNLMQQLKNMQQHSTAVKRACVYLRLYTNSDALAFSPPAEPRVILQMILRGFPPELPVCVRLPRLNVFVLAAVREIRPDTLKGASDVFSVCSGPLWCPRDPRCLIWTGGEKCMMQECRTSVSSSHVHHLLWPLCRLSSTFVCVCCDGSVQIQKCLSSEKETSFQGNFIQESPRKHYGKKIRIYYVSLPYRGREIYCFSPISSSPPGFLIKWPEILPLVQLWSEQMTSDLAWR